MCGLGVWSIGVVMSVGGQVMMGVWPGRGGVAARGVARSRWEVMVGGGGRELEASMLLLCTGSSPAACAPTSTLYVFLTLYGLCDFRAYKVLLMLHQCNILRDSLKWQEG